ncbi:MAG: tyrosine-type recombinase/integrase [Rhodobacteraceae bacterium]|nr:tyrosine-type recombinase/integrase [Paracoccaceae bacterium]
MMAPAPIYDPALPSLADLRQRIEARHDLPLLRRRDMASAIRTLAGWFNLPEENVPASTKYIREKLARVHAIMASVSPRRIQNVRSLVLAAMREAGLSTKLAPYAAPFSAEWQRLWDLLEGDTYAKTELSRFLRYCSVQGIAPEAVTDAVSSEFLAAIEAESFIAKPKTRHQSLCRVWNKMVDQHATSGWPQVRLEVPRYEQRLYRVGTDKVSAAVVADIATYLDHLRGTDVFAGLPKPFRPKSVAAVEGHLWRYLSALHHSGADLQGAASFDALLSPDLVKQGLRWHLERKGNQTSKHIGEIAWALRCYAVKYRAPSPETAAFFAEVMPKLRQQQIGLSAKNLSAMAQFDDPSTVERFLLLPQRLWNLALAKAKTVEKKAPQQDAQLLVQSAVAIEILQFAPMRIENLNHLRLDQHLVWQSGRQDGGRLRMVIPAAEVKNSQALEFLLPEATSARVARYITDWRCLFLPKSNPYLFPGREGKAKDQAALRKQIEKALWEEAAIRLTPHQFRHAAAKLLLDARPGFYEVVRKLLGHKSMVTTYSHYAGAETQAAVELYADIISDHRRTGVARRMSQGPKRATEPTTKPVHGLHRSPSTKQGAARPTGSDLFLEPLSLMGKGGRAKR